MNFLKCWTFISMMTGTTGSHYAQSPVHCLCSLSANPRFPHTKRVSHLSSWILKSFGRCGMVRKASCVFRVNLFCTWPWGAWSWIGSVHRWKDLVTVAASKWVNETPACHHTSTPILFFIHWFYDTSQDIVGIPFGFVYGLVYIYVKVFVGVLVRIRESGTFDGVWGFVWSTVCRSWYWWVRGGPHWSTEHFAPSYTLVAHRTLLRGGDVTILFSAKHTYALWEFM